MGRVTWWAVGEACLAPTRSVVVQRTGIVDDHGIKTLNSKNHHRRSIRLPGYDYAQSGAYFVTICSHEQKCIFGQIDNGRIILNSIGEITEQTWQAIPTHYASVKLDAYVVMPNHVHGILTIQDGPHAIHQRYQPATDAMGPRVQRVKGRSTVGVVVGSFKSAVSRRIGMTQYDVMRPLWQRNYYEHIIRDDESLNRIREYIQTNPLRWQFDRENPDAAQPDGVKIDVDRWESLL